MDPLRLWRFEARMGTHTQQPAWRPTSSTFRKGKKRHLWADAICINREDFAERQQQVRIMCQMFAHATEVPIWLGDHDKEKAKEMCMLVQGASRVEGCEVVEIAIV